MGGQQGEPICDLLVLYDKGNRRVLCFVELKANKSILAMQLSKLLILTSHLKPT